MESATLLTRKILINAPVSTVWRYLTTPDLIKQWMLDTDMEMDISTDWTVGSPIRMKGTMHGIAFENNGQIVQYMPEHVLHYSHLSSLSQLPDVTESYSNLLFSLTPMANQTQLTLTITNFPTDAILKHLGFYWRTAIDVLKEVVEKNVIVANTENAIK